MGSDTEKKIENLKKKIKKLGILDIHLDGGDGDTIKAYESIVKIVEEHSREYPPGYEEALQNFIISMRERVWEKDEKFHRFYFGISDIIFWGLKNYGLKPNECKKICEKILDIEKLFSVFIKEASNA
jgi:hypothetical protein